MELNHRTQFNRLMFYHWTTEPNCRVYGRSIQVLSSLNCEIILLPFAHFTHKKIILVLLQYKVTIMTSRPLQSILVSLSDNILFNSNRLISLTENTLMHMQIP